MKKFKGIIAMVSALVMVVSIGMCAPTFAAGLKDSGARTTRKYVIESVDFVKDVYGDWERQSQIHEAGTKGEGGLYFKGCMLQTTTSFNISVPIKQVSAKLNHEIKKTQISTVLGSKSADAKFPGEQCAYYIRKHWKEYKIKYTVTEKSTWSTGGRGIKTETKTYTKYETIREPQQYHHSDGKWFYTAKSYKKDLPQKIKANQCKNFVCR